MKKAVLAISGGMDSTSLLLHLLREGYEIRCYSFDYGQRHVLELQRLQKNIDYLQYLYKLPVTWSIIDLKSVFSDSISSLLPQSGTEVPEGHYEDETMKKTVIENRNGIFSSIIYGKALSWSNQTGDDVIISLGIHAGDHHIYKDCRPESRDAFALAFKISNDNSEKIDYYTPYLGIDKFGILQDCGKSCDLLNLNFNIILLNTNTCYNPNSKNKACGKCGSCQERLEAFQKLGIVDPVMYQK